MRNCILITKNAVFLNFNELLILFSSLPSLRPLLDVYYLPLTNMRIARTFCFTNNGQALYLVSPTEIQRITYSQETCENLQVNSKNYCIFYWSKFPPEVSAFHCGCLHGSLRPLLKKLSCACELGSIKHSMPADESDVNIGLGCGFFSFQWYWSIFSLYRGHAFLLISYPWSIQNFLDNLGR